jgi:predicted ATPase
MEGPLAAAAGADGVVGGLRSTWQQYHQRIAQVLETQFPELAETQPELLAQHYTAAGLSAQAVSYWQRAGQRASKRSAYLEATYWVATGTILQGFALVAQGQGEEGVTHIRQGIAFHRATGARLIWPAFLALLAEVYGKVGQAETGLLFVDEALAILNQSDERMNETEVYRLKGALLLACSTEQRAEAETMKGPGFVANFICRL